MNSKQIYHEMKKFERLKMAAIDASSIIYLQKIGLLNTLADAVQLVTTPALLNETRFSNLPLHILSDGMDERMPADAQLIALALYKNSALISEDRKILHRAKRMGLNYYNSLMMVLFMFFKGFLSEQVVQGKIEQLKQFARYGQDIWEYGQQLFDVLNQERQ